MSLDFNKGSSSRGGNGGGTSGTVSLIAFGSEPSTPYIPGSKWYYNSKIYTALTTTTKDSGVTPDTNIGYLYNGVLYYWNGSDLTSYNEEGLVHKTGTETISGDKKFTGKLEAQTVSPNDVSEKVATTEWVDRKINKENTKVGVRIYYDNTPTVRLGGAVGKNFTPSTDVTRGVDDFKDHPVFEKVECIGKWNSETGKTDIYVKGSWEYNAYLGSVGFDEFVAKKVFWYKVTITSEYVEIWLSATAEQGYTPAYIDGDNNIVGYRYYGKYEVCFAEGEADNGCCVRKGCVPLTNKQNQQYESLLRAKGQRLMDMQDITAIQLLGIVKYASLDWQAAVGQGITSGWQDNKKVAVSAGDAETPVRYIIVKASEVPATFSQDIEHNVIYLSNYTNGFKVESMEDYTIEDDETAYKKINITGDVATVGGSTTVYYGLKQSGGAADIAEDDGKFTANGAITTAARMPIKVMGMCEWIGNENKAVGGAMNNVVVENSVATATFLKNPKPERNDYEYPSAANDKEWTEVGNIGTASGNNLKFVPTADLSLLAFLPSANNGNKTNDYSYLTSTSGRYSVWYGGSCYRGGYSGGFCLSCNYSLTSAYRNHGARCVLK